MKQRWLVHVIFVLGLVMPVLPFVGSDVSGQVNGTDNTQELINLIGKTCTFYLKSGKQVHGTVWDLDGKSLILNMGGTTSGTQARRFKFAQIKYIYDDAGHRTDVSDQNTPTKPVQSTPYTLTFDSADALGNSEVKVNKSDADDLNDYIRVLNEIDLASRYETSDTSGAGDSNFVKRPTKKTEAESSPDAGLRLHHTSNDTSKIKTSADKKSPSKPNKKDKKRRRHKRRKNLFDKKVRPRYAEVNPQRENLLYKNVWVFRSLILLGTMLAILGLFAMIKFLGLTAFFWGKQFIFPVKLVKMNEHYGVIDQGEADGIRDGDIVRFYRKSGKSIQFIAKVHVIKISERYSAVELIRKKSHIQLEPGDVGCKDRSYLSLLFKKIRIAASHLLRLFARFMFKTAKNIDATKDTTEIDLGQDISETEKSPESNELKKDDTVIRIVDESKLKEEKKSKPPSK